MKYAVSVKAFFIIFLCISLSGAAFGAEYYVSTTGSASGNGSLSAPWDLKTALAQPAKVQPGDTIWLRGGIYKGSFTSSLRGAAGYPIQVRQYPGERATLDSAGSAWQNATLTVNGAWTWYRDFEITNSNPRQFGSARPNGLEVYGPNTKLIGLIIHDTGQGAGIWTQAPDTEAYGNVFYNNGWQGSDRGHGHNIYTQNQTGYKYINNNIMLSPFSYSLHVYSTDTAIDNFQVGKNIFLNGPVLVGGQKDAHNITVDGNYFYAANPSFGYGATNNAGLTFRNNYVAGLSTIKWWNNASVTGNTFFPLNQTGQDLSLSVTLRPGGAKTEYSIDRNVYYQGAVRGGWDFSMYDTSVHNYLYSTWVSATGWDRASSYLTARPTGQKIVLTPSQYDADRGNLAIYNWDKTSTVTVDLSGLGFKNGDVIDIRNAQNYFAEKMTVTYTGAPVTIPMVGWTAAVPYGLSAPLYPVTFPEFGAFVVARRPVTPVNVSVTPGQATLLAGQTQQFSASVSGLANQAVTWAVSPQVGSISASGLYTAPASVSTTTMVQVTAASVGDPTKNASVSVVLQAVAVAASPGSVALTDGQTQQITAQVSGTSNTAVKWTLTPAVGMISATGLYSAPAKVAANSTVVVTVSSLADPSKSATSTILLSPNVALSMAISPTWVSMRAAQTQQFVANVYNATDKSVTWSLSPPVGTISPTGLYTAPYVTTKTAVTITATSNANRTKSIAAVASVEPFVGVVVNAPAASVKAGQSLQLSVQVGGLSSPSVSWSVSPAVGTISAGGLYTAPAKVSAPTVITVKATSLVDSTKFGTVSITVTP